MLLDLLQKLKLGGSVGAALAVFEAATKLAPRLRACDAAVAAATAGRTDPAALRLGSEWASLRRGAVALAPAPDDLRRGLRL